MHVSININRLSIASKPEKEETKSFLGKSIRSDITEKSLNFKPSIDIRGMNGTEAITAVSYFIEDAIMLGITPLRILHGTGSGYLRDVVRQYLHSIPQIKRYHDEHIQLGGAGITIVEL